MATRKNAGIRHQPPFRERFKRGVRNAALSAALGASLGGNINLRILQETEVLAKKALVSQRAAQQNSLRTRQLRGLRGFIELNKNISPESPVLLRKGSPGISPETVEWVFQWRNPKLQGRAAMAETFVRVTGFYGVNQPYALSKGVWEHNVFRQGSEKTANWGNIVFTAKPNAAWVEEKGKTETVRRGLRFQETHYFMPKEYGGPNAEPRKATYARVFNTSGKLVDMYTTYESEMGAKVTYRNMGGNRAYGKGLSDGFGPGLVDFCELTKEMVKNRGLENIGNVTNVWTPPSDKRNDTPRHLRDVLKTMGEIAVHEVGLKSKALGLKVVASLK